MTWAEMHAKSEALAIEATMAAMTRKDAHAKQLFKQAAQFEIEALAAIEPSKVRTRAITAVSAAALAYKGGDILQAQKIIHFSLADSVTPEFARREFIAMLEAIWAEAKAEDAKLDPASTAIKVLKLNKKPASSWAKRHNKNISKFKEKFPNMNIAEFHGSLRAVHLDKAWLELDVNGKKIRVKNLNEKAKKLIGPMVNKSVTVVAQVKKENEFKFIDIGIDE